MTENVKRVRKSLEYSVFDGMFAALMIGFGESFLPVYAVFLKANNIQLGLLNSLPLLLGSLLQLSSNRLLELFRSRKRLVSTAALLQGSMYLPIVFVFFLRTNKVTSLIVLACLYWIFGMILSPAWNSWMGDLVDEKERGSYFGRRNKITGFAAFASTLAAGFILQQFADGGEKTQYLGFVFIFCLAFIARFISFSFLTKKYDPKYHVIEEGEFFTFREFIREARFRNYGLFVLYLSFMNFSIYLIAPFLVPYMLRDLHFDYMTFTVVNSAAIIVKFLSMPVWGRASDQFGTKKVLSLTGFLMPAIPLLWILSRDVLYLVVIQIYSGFIWAGFEISSFNFIFDTTSPKKRSLGIAYYNVLNGICIFSGALIGGIIVRYNELFWSKYLLVFIVSCVLRYVVSFVFIPRLREVRMVEKIPYPKLFFKIISTMPTMGMMYSLIPFRKREEESNNGQM